MTDRPGNGLSPYDSRAYATIIEPRTIRLERRLPGPIERVWAYLTDSEKRGSWLASGEMDLRVGGRVEHVFNNNGLSENDEPPPDKYAEYADEYRMTGEIIAVDPPHLVTYTWPDDAGDFTEVTFELTEDGDEVLLVLTHRRLSDREDIVATSGGWHAHLGTLEARLSNREPEGFWRSFNRLESEYQRLFS